MIVGKHCCTMVTIEHYMGLFTPKPTNNDFMIEGGIYSGKTM